MYEKATSPDAAGATPREFESRILRRLDLRRDQPLCVPSRASADAALADDEAHVSVRRSRGPSSEGGSVAMLVMPGLPR